MATVQEPRPRPKYDAMLETRLAQAGGRVRVADLSIGLLGLACLTLCFALVMILADRFLDLSELTRQMSLVVFLAVAGTYAFRVLARPILLSVNPYYAARQVERMMPEAKNSLVSWLDLRDKPLAPTVRDAV